MNFETNSLFVLGIALLIVCVIPVKLVAPLFGAKNSSFAASGLSLVVGIGLAVLGSMLTGLGLIAVYLGMVIGFITVLRTSIIGTLIMPAVVILIGGGMVQLLSSLGLFGFGPS